MCSHCHDFGNDGLICPLNAENLGQLLEVMCCCFTDGEDRVTQPAHAQSGKLFVKEFDTELASQERNVFDDGQSNSPLLVFGELNYCG